MDPGFLKKGTWQWGSDFEASKAKHKCTVFLRQKGGGSAPHAPSGSTPEFSGQIKFCTLCVTFPDMDKAQVLLI